MAIAMADAYEIGISLALDDGVSAGISIIRRDLAALDRAIANTGRNLSQLRCDAATPSLFSIASSPLAETVPRKEVESIHRADVVKPVVMDVALSASPPVAVEASAIDQPRGQLALASANAHDMISSTAASASAPVMKRDNPAPQQNAKVFNPNADTAVASAARPPSAPTSQGTPPALPRVSPAAPPTGSLKAFSSKEPGIRLTAERSPAVTQGASAGDLQNNARTSGPIAPVSQPPVDQPPVILARRMPDYADQEGFTSSVGQPPVSRAFASTVTRTPALPAQFDRHAASPPTLATPSSANSNDHLPVAPASSSRNAPQQNSFSIGPAQAPSAAAPESSLAQAITLQGDIILDGVRVGRWLTSTLARQAARPTASPTGPDPRQTPLWSGQAQGF